MKLTATEKAHGWRVWACPTHGELVAAPASAVVVCGVCRKKAKPT